MSRADGLQAAGADPDQGRAKAPAFRRTAPGAQGLYRPAFEHDACGTGFVADRHGRASHDVVRIAATALERMEHRGAAGADAATGDGAGLLLTIPDRFFREVLAEAGVALPSAGRYAVASLFLPRDPEIAARAMEAIRTSVYENGMEVLHRRDVPVNIYECGQGARACMPTIVQLFLVPRNDRTAAPTELQCYVLRRAAEKALSAIPGCYAYFPSLSTRTVVYKGMLHSSQLRRFYPELDDPRLESRLCLLHSRFSTNTFPSWDRAQPCRMVAHNGEINTLRCVENAIRSREGDLRIATGDDETGPDVLAPLLQANGSDSMKFDNLLELLTAAGRELPAALMMMVPGPWSSDPSMDAAQRAFYEYAQCVMPPWDGPAAMCFSDGVKAGATLDRNGLRPARFSVSRDGLVVLASEAGVTDLPASEIVMKGKLGPGQMILVDTATGEILLDEEIKRRWCAGDYARWLEEGLTLLAAASEEAVAALLPTGGDASGASPLLTYGDELVVSQHAFGYTYEDLAYTVAPMAEDALDPVGAMGADIPLAVLSGKPQPLFHYFKQQFAQVTNPPIDALREACVVGTEVFLGPSGDLLSDGPAHCRKVLVPTPVLDPVQFEALRSGAAGLKVRTLRTRYPVNEGGKGIRKSMDLLVNEAIAAIGQGAELLVLSDRGITRLLAALPSLLAVSGLHQALVARGLRARVGLVLDSFEPREVHHFACLVGFGCDAVHPYGAYSSVHALAAGGFLRGKPAVAIERYREAVEHGVVKVMSKMGISTIQGYQGAQIFEAVGLSADVRDRWFAGTESRVDGVTVDDIAEDCARLHRPAFEGGADLPLPTGGRTRFRRDGERHLYDPMVIHLIQQAARTNDPGLFAQYREHLRKEANATLRSLLDFTPGTPVPLDEVEPAEAIMRRFKTGAMSYGSISKEAHEALAEAMNRIGGRSNSGEGGEEPERLGTSRNSAIKQVASGRFGVTGHYLASAKEIQIKIAQGAKPGEGGQLPAKKVYPWIARTRHSTPGVGLISPPPHHDIYSIEDLAQLIYDLKQANPRADINVKLVSGTGVGTIAAGVAKGGADIILVSGFDGGTGASPRTSIYHAGLPWELGLSETHQTLMLNGLRGRVRLEVDGKLMTGRDIAVAAMLGAEEFGFATLPLVVLGCVMMRVCNLDTCPVGVATQNPELRALFSGRPDHVVNLFRLLSEDLRREMAALGFRTVDEMVGRSDRLVQREAAGRAGHVDLSGLIAHFGPRPPKERAAKAGGDEWSLFMDAVGTMVEKDGVRMKSLIRNTQRTVGTRVGAFVSERYVRLPEGTMGFEFEGCAGQSFGAFVPEGIDLFLTGEANDYVGKGLSGGRIVVRRPADAGWQDEHNVLAGNVVLYGATGGELFVGGRAGERFCVRNSGAKAVVEGVGDHGCEYMTGGVAVILGSVGRNFAAGMSGGVAYLLDGKGAGDRINPEMVSLLPCDAEDLRTIEDLLEKHAVHTGSPRARQLLKEWPEAGKRFLKVLPQDYRAMLQAIETARKEGCEGDALLDRAFEIRMGKGA